MSSRFPGAHAVSLSRVPPTPTAREVIFSNYLAARFYHVPTHRLFGPQRGPAPQTWGRRSPCRAALRARPGGALKAPGGGGTTAGKREPPLQAEGRRLGKEGRGPGAGGRHAKGSRGSRPVAPGTDFSGPWMASSGEWALSRAWRGAYAHEGLCQISDTYMFFSLNNEHRFKEIIVLQIPGCQGRRGEAPEVSLRRRGGVATLSGP